MLLIDFLAAILATNQVVEIWNHGSIFASQRARVSVSESWIATLLQCMFCLSVWVGFLVALSVLVTSYIPDLYALPIRVFGYGLAVSRAANLLNDLTHSSNRTPHPYDDFADIGDDWSDDSDD